MTLFQCHYAFSNRRAKDLIRQLLAVDPHHRPGATECLAHPWVGAAAAAAAGAAAGAGAGASHALVDAQARLRHAYAVSAGREGFAAAMAAGKDAAVHSGGA